MTSHEMRNPLSAMFQCADAIIAALTPCLEVHEKTPGNHRQARISVSIQDIPERLSHAIEAAATISLCAQHQKR